MTSELLHGYIKAATNSAGRKADSANKLVKGRCTLSPSTVAKQNGAPSHFVRRASWRSSNKFSAEEPGGTISVMKCVVVEDAIVSHHLHVIYTTDCCSVLDSEMQKNSLVLVEKIAAQYEIMGTLRKNSKKHSVTSP